MSPLGTGVPGDILSSLGTGVTEDKMSSVGTGLLDAPARPSGGGRPSRPLPGTCSGAACGADDAFGALSANRRQLSAPQANVSLDLLAGSALNRRLLAKSAPNGYECPYGRSKRGEQGATARADAGVCCRPVPNRDKMSPGTPVPTEDMPGHPRPHRGHVVLTRRAGQACAILARNAMTERVAPAASRAEREGHRLKAFLRGQGHSVHSRAAT